jgi:hypothetical protein
MQGALRMAHNAKPLQHVFQMDVLNNIHVKLMEALSQG